MMIYYHYYLSLGLHDGYYEYISFTVRSPATTEMGEAAAQGVEGPG
jgi:hypothetical protein